MLKHAEVTEKIRQAFYRVYNALGPSFLEKVYENSMVVELERAGVEVLHQAPIEANYSGVKVGQYIADLCVTQCVVVEGKAADKLCDDHVARLLKYLKATCIEVGQLLNFGPKAEMKRKVFENARKHHFASYSDP